MLGPSWNGCYGLNCGLLFVPPYYLYNAGSPLSHLLGETGHFLLLGGISLVFSMGFLCFTGNFQSQRGVREAAWESSWDVLCGRMSISVVPADNGMRWADRERQLTAVLQTYPQCSVGSLSCHLNAFGVRMRPLKMLGSHSSVFGQLIYRSLGVMLALLFHLTTF